MVATLPTSKPVKAVNKVPASPVIVIGFNNNNIIVTANKLTSMMTTNVCKSGHQNGEAVLFTLILPNLMFDSGSRNRTNKPISNQTMRRLKRSYRIASSPAITTINNKLFTTKMKFI